MILICSPNYKKIQANPLICNFNWFIVKTMSDS